MIALALVQEVCFTVPWASIGWVYDVQPISKGVILACGDKVCFYDGKKVSVVDTPHFWKGETPEEKKEKEELPEVLTRMILNIKPPKREEKEFFYRVKAVGGYLFVFSTRPAAVRIYSLKRGMRFIKGVLFNDKIWDVALWKGRYVLSGGGGIFGEDGKVLWRVDGNVTRLEAVNGHLYALVQEKGLYVVNEKFKAKKLMGFYKYKRKAFLGTRINGLAYCKNRLVVSLPFNGVLVYKGKRIKDMEARACLFFKNRLFVSRWGRGVSMYRIEKNRLKLLKNINLPGFCGYLKAFKDRIYVAAGPCGVWILDENGNLVDSFGGELRAFDLKSSRQGIVIAMGYAGKWRVAGRKLQRVSLSPFFGEGLNIELKDGDKKVVGDRGCVRLLDSSGSVIWETILSDVEAKKPFGRIVESIVKFRGKYYAVFNSYIWEISPQTGEVISRFEVPEGEPKKLKVISGKLYVLCQGRCLLYIYR